VEEARHNAQLAGVEVLFREGDVEALPFDDASFDVVTSEFGHMFAPRPEVAIAEMRRVLKPGGRVVFATWPPEHLVGQFFTVLVKYAPPPPPGLAPPPQWGVPAVIAERLAAGFHPPFFGRGVMTVPALSLGHFRAFMEHSVGPLRVLVEGFAGDSQKLEALRHDMDAVTRPYYSDNLVHQHYLFTRAVAR
jgi:SAM-dependent methyltransferase